MRHKKKGKTLGRVKAQRIALMRSLAESLILHGGIETTLAKAKALRPFVEPLITKAKTGTLANRRQLIKVLYTDKVLNMLMDDIAPRYKDRAGGYTRIIKLGFRQSDGSPIARIELV
ncbi:MAG: 50S ribosomal protein L17 [Candidatus Magasanikbacteria bacterium]|jgi:large subunit ribosomal protein L17|nr:50S ribosomal protein L17 [Candidatus Magasanikbacteria bacterium]MBT4221400.1 50S ribosomal protein L17 [Candidatus Magasanikbacteria bacterium]MBT4350752.1 50S ribosomal protein L17 [Candidatus Magasanikbacteria bacterium]MBT4541572.1 50S ribosomal protein L17 [Candidatus Magasanikbacteria bacterium]MBT6253524.1 50S ribosomal protein L17 [Candidatus Magasanikbacteria bacterium]